VELYYTTPIRHYGVVFRFILPQFDTYIQIASLLLKLLWMLACSSSSLSFLPIYVQ